ncbi:hypothetical protein NMY22_g11706 [Coprinellus aureogranulatus]|nr:hypothetical protein NMY22_g11706 [Coprinellus aureogranulatus]
MGRPAKYYTREERLAARRARRAERYRDPSFVQTRSSENRRWYAKKRLEENAKITIPDHIRAASSQPFTFEDESVVVRFRGSFNIESLKNTAVSDVALETLSKLPPYPNSIIDLVDIDEDWDALSGALYGYQLRKYIEAQTDQVRMYRIQTKVAVSTDLVRQFNRLQEMWGVFDKAVKRYISQLNVVGRYLSSHNARWTAVMMVYIQEDLEALKKNDDSYVTRVYDRILHLQSLYDS